jgi:hypothetical protein
VSSINDLLVSCEYFVNTDERFLSFQLVGLAIIVLSVWMITDPTFYVRMAQDESSYHTGIYIFLAVGALMFIVGFLGCCGAYREAPCMLVSVRA